MKKSLAMQLYDARPAIILALGVGIWIWWDVSHSQSKVKEPKGTVQAAGTGWDGNPNHPDCSKDGHPDPKHPGAVISDMYTEACTADGHLTGKPVESTSYSQPYRTTPWGLSSKFHANEVKAEQELAGKAIILAGQVLSVRRGLRGEAIVRFASPDEFIPVAAYLYSGQDDDAARLTTGQRVSVNCERVEMVLGSPLLRECLLLIDTNVR